MDEQKVSSSHASGQPDDQSDSLADAETHRLPTIPATSRRRFLQGAAIAAAAASAAGAGVIVASRNQQAGRKLIQTFGPGNAVPSGCSLVVTTTNDSGSGSLRQALLCAQSGDTITFDPSLANQTITLTSGALVLPSITLTIDGGTNNITISGNSASQIFIINSGVTATISGLKLSHANAGGSYYGGALHIAGTATISDCTLSVNMAYEGGGAYITGTATFTNCTIQSNGATNGAGAYNAGTASFTGCTFATNNYQINTSGACVYNVGTLTMTNCTCANNSCATYGGGIYNDGTASLINCTIASNYTSNGGGVFVGKPVTFQNTIVANNYGFYGSNDVANFYNSVTSLGYNCIGTTSGSTGWVGTDLQNTNPNLGSLASNGGPTQTMALQSTSPCIDYIPTSNLPTGMTTDQRGDARPDGAETMFDVGAYEYQD